MTIQVDNKYNRGDKLYYIYYKHKRKKWVVEYGCVLHVCGYKVQGENLVLYHMDMPNRFIEEDNVFETAEEACGMCKIMNGILRESKI